MKTQELFERGHWLGDVEILGRLRAGGMATLFLGRRHSAAGVSRAVVVKVIHSHLAEDELIVKMFIDEARISSQISHSNVVYVERFGEHEGVFYMVMEYVDGCSLEQVLRTLQRRDEHLATAVAVHLVIEAAAGLHAAHETTDEDGNALGIVHRDVSPSNVLLTRNGRVKVIDFGIAKARGRLNETKSGANLKGKLRYMSPEQAWGHELDRRTDVYALGIVLWELLCRRPLFKAGEELAVLELVRNPVVPSAREINPDVSLALESVIGRALAKNRDQRIASAADLRAELIRAVPDSISVPADALGELVTKVRETLGVSEAEDRKATTPAFRSQTPASELDISIDTPPNADTSVGGAAGQIGAQPAKRRGLFVLGGAAVALVVGTVLVMKIVQGGGDDAPVQAAAMRAAAPAIPVDAAVAMPPDAAQVQDAPVAATKPSPSKKPVIVVKKPVATKSVSADGVLLADPNATPKQPTKPKPKTKPKAVQVDGTVLSE